MDGIKAGTVASTFAKANYIARSYAYFHLAFWHAVLIVHDLNPKWREMMLMQLHGIICLSIYELYRGRTR